MKGLVLNKLEEKCLLRENSEHLVMCSLSFQNRRIAEKKTLFAIRFINQLKGTVSVISSDPVCKDTMPDVKIEPNKSLDI